MKPLYFLGRGAKGEAIIGGLFQMHDQQGFSLTDSMIQCKKHGMLPGLIDFCIEARKVGWSWELITRTVREAIGELK